MHRDRTRRHYADLLSVLRRLYKLMNAFCERLAVPVGAVRFTFESSPRRSPRNGTLAVPEQRVLRRHDTPASLGMCEFDRIDVCLRHARQAQ